MNKENRTLNIGWKDLNAGQDEKEIIFLLEQIQVLKNKNNQLQSELNELKERHRKDVEMAYERGYNNGKYITNND